MRSSFLKARRRPRSVLNNSYRILARHTVRHERPFEVRRRGLLESPLSGEPLHIEDVLDPGRPLSGKGVSIERRHHGIDDLRDPALGQCAIEKVLIGRNPVGSGEQNRMIDGFQKSLSAGSAVVGHGHVHDIPRNLSCDRLSTKFGEPAPVPFGANSNARCLRERLEVGLDLAALVGPAPGGHRDRAALFV